MTQLNLSDDDVVRLLHSLSCAKYKILNKEPNTKTISPNDHFEFNAKFSDKMRRIKVYGSSYCLVSPLLRSSPTIYLPYFFFLHNECGVVYSVDPSSACG